MAAPQTYGNDQYVNNQPQINILSQKFEQDPNTGNYEYSYEQDNGQAVSYRTWPLSCPKFHRN